MFTKGNYGEYLTFSNLEKLPGYKKILTNIYVKKEDGTSLDTNETQHESILTKETNIKIDSEQNLNNEFKPE